MISALDEALEKRQALISSLEQEGTEVYRLLALGEAVQGLTVDRYGPVALFHLYEGKFEVSPEELRAAAQWCLDRLHVKSVYQKHFVADRSRQIVPGQLYSPEPLLGTTAPPKFEVLESGLRYLVQPYAGFSTGLFVDQRDNRRVLARLASKARVLNLFSYTCAFSVACASQGARVTSIDFSKKYLQWGRENYSANQLPLERQRFITEDAFVFCEKEGRRKSKYDLVIVDPPSFSRDKKGKVFSLSRDLGKLIRVIEPLVTEGGSLFFSCNLSDMTSPYLERVVRAALNRRATKQTLPPLPQDYALGEHFLSYGLFRLD